MLVDPGDGRLDTLLRAKLPPDVWSAREKALAEEMPTLPVAVRKEYDALALSGAEASRAFPLPHIPIVLLTGTQKNPEFPGNPIEQDLKLQLHNELATKVPGITHVLVPESRHYIQNDAPDKVIGAVRQVLNELARSPGQMGGILPGVEPRLRASIIYVGGFDLRKALPEVEPINFTPRITIPTLMLNGRYDIFYPVEWLSGIDVPPSWCFDRGQAPRRLRNRPQRPPPRADQGDAELAGQVPGPGQPLEVGSYLRGAATNCPRNP